MSLGKSISLGFLVLGCFVVPAQADPITSSTGSGQWTFWSQATNSTIAKPSYAPSLDTAPKIDPLPRIVPSVTTSTVQSPSSPPVAPSISSSSVPTFSSMSSPTDQPDAFINFGNGSYLGAASMTEGTIQPWFQSPAVTQAFGGVPSSQQQADFAQTVLSRVEQTFKQSGVDVNLTLDPNTEAPHTLSVVSGASYGLNPDAIGIAEIGGSGFSFIDKLSYANSIDKLAWADAHNIAHELMHAFGVATHHDQSGQYLDAATANWDMLTDSKTMFSPEASAELRNHLASIHSGNLSGVGEELLGGSGLEGRFHCECGICKDGRMLAPMTALELGAAPVPEPATMVLWGLGAIASLVSLRRRSNASSSQGH